jgi:hypothetical protein
MQNDELDYLIDGLQSGNAVARKASGLGLVEAIATPRSRFLLRLSGGLPRLLAAMAVAETTSREEVVTRLCLATIAVTIIQDRANIEHVSPATVQGLLALASPLGDNETGGSSSSSNESSSNGAAAKSGGGGWRKKHALGGSKANALRSQVDDEGMVVREHLRRSARVAPYQAETVLPEELALLALQRALSGSKNGRSFQGANGQSQRQSLDLSSSAGLAVLVRIVTRSQHGWPLLHALELLEHASSQSVESQQLLSTGSLLASLVSLVNLEGALSSSSSPPWPCDVVGAALRVLINVTHHNPTAVGMALQQGIVPPLLASLRKHNIKLEEGAAEWLLEEEGETGEGGEDASGAHPSFDLSLLTMNALTNCVEISADARDLVASSIIEEEGGVGGGDGATIPFLATLVGRRAAAFKQELAKPLEGAASHVAEESEKEADEWPVEDLVVCGYASLLLGCLVRDRPDNYTTLQVTVATKREFRQKKTAFAYLRKL